MADDKKELDGVDAYNIVADTVAGVNIHLRPGLCVLGLQASAFGSSSFGVGAEHMSYHPTPWRPAATCEEEGSCRTEHERVPRTGRAALERMPSGRRNASSTA